MHVLGGIFTVCSIKRRKYNFNKKTSHLDDLRMSIDNTYRKYTKSGNQTSIIHLCRRSNKKLISHHNDFFLDIKKQYTYIKYMYNQIT